MAEVSFVPGPWSLSAGTPADDVPPTFCYAVSGEGWRSFAPVVTRMEGKQEEDVQGLATANLIAAAPDLCAALLLHRTYEAMPTDRGGPNGPKGKAYTAFVAARDAALAKAGVA